MLTRYDDIWLVGGARTAFADYNGTLKDVSATDLGITAAKGAMAKLGVDPALIDVTVVGNVAQTSLDAYYISRHIAQYSGVSIDKSALTVSRICCSGFEAIAQGATAIQMGSAQTALSVGTESMSRNPVVSYSMRSGFKLGQVQFYDFLWETLKDPAPGILMGQTAENLAKQYQLTRDEVDGFAADSFARSIAAQQAGYFDDEIVSVTRETHTFKGYADRKVVLPRGVDKFDADDHVRPTSREQLAKLAPVFSGVQTAGNSSAIVDGAGAVVVASGEIVRREGLKPRARIVSASAAGVPPEVMGIGPVAAIREILEAARLSVSDIGRFEINEAFGAQVLAVERELGIDHARFNANGGSIAMGHPLGTSGIRCTLTAARAAKQSGERYAIAGACAGGGQGMAILLEVA